MIKTIIKCLSENTEVSDWLINEITTESFEAFYVLQKLETTRSVNTKEYLVTVYHKFSDNQIEYLGSSSFKIEHKLAKQAVKKLIDEALFAAKYIKNPPYELAPGVKKSFREKIVAEPFLVLEEIAQTYFAQTNEQAKFNSLELFLKNEIVHVLNSRGVNLKKTLQTIGIEAIPSYDGPDLKVELYKYYTHKAPDLEKISAEAKRSLEEVKYRYEAKSITTPQNIDVILGDNDAAELFDELISNYSYSGIYKQFTEKKIGDLIQKEAGGDLLTIGLTTSKANAFDRDGIILEPVTVIENGKLINYYGNNQYANYLKIKPTGNLPMLSVKKGKAKTNVLMAKPHIKVLALSGIQLDIFSGYIGGEVRLAVYFDGTDYHPVSGFSFSGDLNKCLETIKISQEGYTSYRYHGPKYVKLTDMRII